MANTVTFAGIAPLLTGHLREETHRKFKPLTRDRQTRNSYAADVPQAVKSLLC
jgi:hypothetical protein